MKFSGWLFMFIHLAVHITAQNGMITGMVRDGKEPLPFATILVKGTTIGTSSNQDGKYALKLAPGKYQVVYQYIGYTKRTETVVVDGVVQLDVTLKPESFSLNEVQVKAGEDPSYPIIRKAIKKRKYYRNQVDHYTCNTYIKNLQRLTNLPKNMGMLMKLLGGKASDTSDMRGVIYLSESVSKYYFRKPNEEKEVMVSSKVSGNNQSFSFNKLSDLSINFNDNLVEMGGISTRPFISPIHNNAFFFYRFFLIGKITSEGKVINKIKVVPKRRTDPCFRGFIYIQDSTWRITGVDFMVPRETKINFVDTLLIKQVNAPVVADSIWMPVSISLGYRFSAFGFVGNGHFLANIKDYDLNTTIDKKFFGSEKLLVEDGSNKKDSSYWNAVRPIPLTKEEATDYREKDSIAAVRSTDRYKDSVDKVNNKFEMSNLFMGYSFNDSKRKLSYSLPGIITYGIQYNTVEGVNLSYNLGLRKELGDEKNYTLNGRIRYGFSNHLAGGEFGGTYYYNPRHFSSAGGSIKSIVEQFNKRDPISPLINSLYTLYLNDNFMKLYRETGGSAFYNTEVSNGVYFAGNVSYYQRDALSNSTDRLIIDDKHKLFTSNDPLASYAGAFAETASRAFVAEVTLNFRFFQKYYTYPHVKYIVGSKYPRLGISYKKAMPVLYSQADYDVATATVWDHIGLGLVGKFSYRLRGGVFLNNKRTYFMDYRHFLGNQTIFNTNDYLNSYRLLPYYTYSTNQWFVEAHAEHHFHGFIANKIPYIKRLRVQEVAGFHFLSNNLLSNYYEINFGLEGLFKVIRVDYVLGYGLDNKVRQGFTIGMGLSL